MNYYCHKVGGITTAGILTYYAHYHHLLIKHSFSWELLNSSNEIITTFVYIAPLPLLFISAYMASTLPDIDHPSSLHGKNHRIISQFLSNHGGHRGWTHYPFTLICFMSIFYGIYYNISFHPLIQVTCYWVFMGILGGWASHIVLDLFNRAGLSLFMPFSRVRVKIPSGISYKNHKIRWRYLRGGNVLDDFLILIICFFVFIISVLLINPHIVITIVNVLTIKSNAP